jgi:CRP-like cAMP-binding protein
MSEDFYKLRTALQSIGNFSDKDMEQLANRCKPFYYKANSFLLKQGEVCRSIWLITSGSFRQYSVAETGDEVTVNLLIENDWVLDYKSFTSQKPSDSAIEAHEDSHVLALSVLDLHSLMNISPTFFQVARVFQFALIPHEVKATKVSPADKYAQLLKEKPGVIRKFPLKYIASYLGITQETLSRIRSKID